MCDKSSVTVVRAERFGPGGVVHSTWQTCLCTVCSSLLLVLLATPLAVAIGAFAEKVLGATYIMDHVSPHPGYFNAIP
jgi:hypothetical protein